MYRNSRLIVSPFLVSRPVVSFFRSFPPLFLIVPCVHTWWTHIECGSHHDCRPHHSQSDRILVLLFFVVEEFFFAGFSRFLVYVPASSAGGCCAYRSAQYYPLSW